MGAFGVVSDGCGSARHSEVGAALTAATLGRWLACGLAHGLTGEVAVRGALSRLVRALSAIVGATMGSSHWGGQEERVRFVREHLLATAVGFYATTTEVVLFCWGDGVLLVDDETWLLDRQDRPDYPAYQLLRGRSPSASPAGLPVEIRKFRTAQVRRVAVATDGFDPELLPQAFGKRDSALTRWMRVRAQDGHFRDDATVAMLEVSS